MRAGRVRTYAEREAGRVAEEAALVRELSGRVLIGNGAAYVLAPILCGIPKCGAPAATVDPFAPFYTELSRCAAHGFPVRPSPSSEKQRGDKT